MKTPKYLATAVASVLLLAASGARADAQRESMEELRNTVINLLQALVDQGVMTKEKAGELVKSAQEQAAQTAATRDTVEEGAVRVTYVPEVVREQLRKEVAEQMRAEVAAQVVEQAKEQGWGVPGALPDWLSRVTWTGDIRFRGRVDLFDPANVEGVQLDFATINSRGGIGKAGLDAFTNVTEDRQRMQVQARLLLEGAVSNDVTVGARLVTGNLRDPGSNNETLGQYGARFTVGFDLAYLRYEPKLDTGFKWLTVVAGRTANPYLSTELVFDRDLTFDGVAATFRMPFADRREASNAFLTIGAHPLDESDFVKNDKWLLAGQLGADFRFDQDHRLQVAAAYYDYLNTQGRRNTLDSTRYDYTAPRNLRRGNTLFDIRNDTDVNTNLFALAGQYRLVNATVNYQLPLGPNVFTLGADYVKNIGWKADDVLAVSGIRAKARVTGYNVESGYGSQRMSDAWAWRVFFGYRYLQRDAVLDLFTDSDFHGGGTDAQGFIVGGELALPAGITARARYLAADEIDGPVFAPGANFVQDVFMLDFTSRF